MEQLREEALRYRLPVRSDAYQMIDAIMSHLETNSPLIEMLQPPGENTSRHQTADREEAAWRILDAALELPPHRTQNASITLEQVMETVNRCNSSNR